MLCWCVIGATKTVFGCESAEDVVCDLCQRLFVLEFVLERSFMFAEGLKPLMKLRKAVGFLKRQDLSRLLGGGESPLSVFHPSFVQRFLVEQLFFFF